MTISPQTSAMSLPAGYTFRRVQKSDYQNNYLETLKGLTVVGDIPQAHFDQTIDFWNQSPHVYNNMVVTDAGGRVVATGNLVVEQKMIHHCGRVGHIEDIAVSADQQGKQLGKLLISSLLEIARREKCYKVILDCDPKNVGFYEKCGMAQCGVEMSIRYDK
ncbi:hypothetical protein DICA0_C10902 [Diutina catenulata]